MSGLVHVLMAEDDPGDALVRESFAQAGRNSPFPVVPDGDEALRFLRRSGEYSDAARPGLVPLDLNLHGPGGLEVLAQVKADLGLRISPVIVLSSSQSPDDIRRSYELHANANIVKPRGFDGFTAMTAGARVLSRPCPVAARPGGREPLKPPASAALRSEYTGRA